MPRSRTTFSKENPRPGPGRKKLTEEEKRKARLQRAVDYDYKAELRALLPIAIDQIGERVAAGKMKDPDLIRAFSEVRDSVHGKPAQTIQGADGGPLMGTFVALLGQIDGAKVEKLTAPFTNGNGANGHANGNGSHEKL